MSNGYIGLAQSPMCSTLPILYTIIYSIMEYRVKSNSYFFGITDRGINVMDGVCNARL
jgi:hypothetical protein